MPSIYDQQPPFWFRHAFFVGLPFAALMVPGGTYRSPLLLALGLVPLLVFMLASVLWSRQHKVE